MNLIKDSFGLTRQTSLVELNIKEEIENILAMNECKEIPSGMKDKIISIFFSKKFKLNEEFKYAFGEKIDVKTLNTVINEMELTEENIRFVSYFIIRSAFDFTYLSDEKCEIEYAKYIFSSLLHLLNSDQKEFVTNVCLVVFKFIALHFPEVSKFKELKEIAKYGDFTNVFAIKELNFSSFLYNICSSLEDCSLEDKVNIIENLSKSIKNFKEQQQINELFNIFSLVDFDGAEGDIKERLINVAKSIAYSGGKINKEVAQKLIRIIFDDEKLSEEKIKVFMQLFYAEEIEDITEPKTIKNSLLINYLVPLFQKSDKIVELLHLLLHLTNYSEDNIYELHRARIELVLLDLIKNTDDNSINRFAGTIVAFLILITSTISSQDVVHSFIGLLLPKGNEELIKQQKFFMFLFTETINKNASEQYKFLTINDETPEIQVVCPSKTFFGQDFLVDVWLKIPLSIQKTFETRVFNIIQNGNEVISSTIKDNSLILNHNESLKINAPHNKWFLLSLEFKRTQQSYELSANVDGNYTNEIINLQNIDLSLIPSVEFIFAGRHEKINFMPKLGPFSISLKQFNNKQTLASVRFDYNENNEIVLVNELNYPEINIAMNGTKQKRKKLFIDVLVDDFGLNTLMPLFSPLCSDKNDKANAGFTMRVMSIFIIVLKHVPIAEKEFLANGGFESISCILMKQNAAFISYTLYKSVYSFFLDVKSSKLKEDALYNFLLNFKLWVHAPGEEQTLIFRHWARHIFSKHIEEAIKYISFKDVLLALRTMFWYTETEKDVILYGKDSEVPRPTDLPIKTIRSSIIQVAYNIAINDFSEDNIRELIGQVVTVKDIDQICDMLVFVKLLSLTDNKPYSKAMDARSLFNVMHCLLNNEDDNIIFNVLDVFATLHLAQHMTTPKDIVHVNILMDVIPQKFFNIEMFSLLITFVLRFKSFSPLLFFAMTQFEHENIQILTMKNLKPDTEFANNKNWVVWPIVAALYKGGLFHNFIIDFIARSSEKNWKYTFCAIDVIGRALGVQCETTKSIFLNQLCKHLLEMPLQGYEAQHNFFDIACFFIFFRTNKNELLLPLDELFSNSPFDYTSLREQNKKVTKKQLAKTNLYAKIKEIAECETQSYSFGLRFNKEGQWLDVDLALNICKQARRTKCQTFHNVACILAAFAIESRENEALEQICRLRTAKVASPIFLEIIKRRDKKYTGKQINTECFELLIEKTEKYNQEIVELSKTVAEKFYHFYEKSNEAKETIFGISDDDLTLSAMKYISSYRNMINTKDKITNKRVAQILETTSFNGGPFEVNKDVTGKTQLVRSSIGCSHFCPTKYVEKDYVETNDERKNTDEEYLISEENYRKTLIDKYASCTLHNVPKPITMENITEIYIPATLITIKTHENVTLLLKNDHFEIIFANDFVKVFDANNVIKVMFRAYMNLPTGLEIFTVDRKTYLLSVNGYNSYTILNNIASIEGFEDIEITTKEALRYTEDIKLQEKWVNREISTFDYLMKLNDIAGRSFNSLSIYPIMPNIKKGRDLSKPMPNNMSKREVLRLLSTREPFKQISKTLFDRFIDEQTITDVDEIKSELTPEFYCSPNFLSDNVKLPNGINTCLDYVMQMRRFLESDEVTKDIPRWIDLTFGYLQSGTMSRSDLWTNDSLKNINNRIDIKCHMEFNGIHPLKIFTKPHPSRKSSLDIYSHSSINKQCYCGNIDVLYQLFNDNSNNSIPKATIISKDGKVFQFSLSCQENEISTEISEELYKLNIKESTTRNKVDNCGNGIVFGSETGETILINDKHKQVIHQFHSPVKCIAADESHIITCYKSRTANILQAKSPFSLCYSVHSFRGKIECCAISSVFDFAAIGVSDKTVDIISVSTGMYERTLNVKNTPRKILITKDFGFIVIYSSDDSKAEITVFSNDGKLLNCIELPYLIKEWCYTKTKEMFDGICLCNEENEIFAVKQLYLQIR